MDNHASLPSKSPNGNEATAIQKPKIAGDDEAGQLQWLLEARRTRERIQAGTVDSLKPSFNAALDRFANPSPTVLAAQSDREQSEASRKEASRGENCQRRWDEVAAKMGARYRGCTLENFRVTCDAQRVVVYRLQEFGKNLLDEVRAGRNLILTGPCGTGKDHLMAALARIACEQHGISVDWWNGMRMYSAMRDGIDNTKFTECGFIDALTRQNVLAISDPVPPAATDDLTGWQKNTLLQVVNARYCELRPIWVTLNTPSESVARQRMSEPIIERLTDGALVLRCDWPSFRGPLDS